MSVLYNRLLVRTKSIITKFDYMMKHSFLDNGYTYNNILIFSNKIAMFFVMLVYVIIPVYVDRKISRVL